MATRAEAAVAVAVGLAGLEASLVEGALEASPALRGAVGKRRRVGIRPRRRLALDLGLGGVGVVLRGRTFHLRGGGRTGGVTGREGRRQSRRRQGADDQRQQQQPGRYRRARSTCGAHGVEPVPRRSRRSRPRVGVPNRYHCRPCPPRSAATTEHAKKWLCHKLRLAEAAGHPANELHFGGSNEPGRASRIGSPVHPSRT